MGPRRALPARVRIPFSGSEAAVHGRGEGGRVSERSRSCAALAAAPIVFLFVLGAAPSAGADPHLDRNRPYYVNVLFYGAGENRYLTRLLLRPDEARFTEDRLTAVSLGYEYARALDGRLAFEVEGFYGFHHPRGSHHEVGLALNARWRDFPWNRWVPTTVAIGMGPSWTTGLLPIEQGDGRRSKLLNQFNIEATIAYPYVPELALVGRIQHRSGMFGLIRGVEQGSNFVMLGVKWRFGLRSEQ